MSFCSFILLNIMTVITTPKLLNFRRFMSWASGVVLRGFDVGVVCSPVGWRANSVLVCLC